LTGANVLITLVLTSPVFSLSAIDE